MANTYELIASSTVGLLGATDITFSSIPATYTDLILKFSLRTTRLAAVDDIIFDFNGSTANFTVRRIIGTGSGVSSAAYSSGMMAFSDAASNAASTFGNGEMYLPNYASSAYKSISVDSVTEDNATAAYSFLTAGLWSSTSAINSIKMRSDNSATFVQYSTAYLYGVKNA